MRSTFFHLGAYKQMRCTESLLRFVAGFHDFPVKRWFRPATVNFSRVLFVTLFLVSISARAQNSMAGHDMGQMKEIPPPEKLPPPLKMNGIGNSHLAIKATPEAQAWFDQGLTLLHDFWDYESIR